MTTLLIIGCAALVAGTVVLILAFTEACRPRSNRARLIVAFVVGGFVFGAGVVLIAQQTAAAADPAKASVSGKALVTPGKVTE